MSDRRDRLPEGVRPDALTSEGDDAYLRYRAAQALPEFDLDRRERERWERQTRRAKLTQAAVAFWLCASPFVVVPLLLRQGPWWVAAVAAAAIGSVIGYLLPTNLPPPRQAPPTGGSYGVYDPRGPYGPRS